MTLKLSKLPNRTPVKITVTLPPNVHEDLTDYARIYEQTHGDSEKIEDLLPYIIAAFLDADKGFQKARRQLNTAAPKPTTRPPIGTAAKEGDS
tara:strand:+ start:852 stop:1130 length:279 start_codon:yes stop_codon:yes gene_type:complete